MNSTALLKTQILEQGCFSPEENQRIYDKWFAPGPRYLFRSVDRKYDLKGKMICDVGCLYGVNLTYCQPGSYGIDVDSRAIQFGNSVGLTIHNLDLLYDDVSHLPQVEAVWCSAVMEHVESPHIFLRKINQLLKPNGLLALYVPTIPLIPGLRRLPIISRYANAYLYSDHINAFVPSTLRFFIERAGFETLEVSPFFPRPVSVLNHVPYLNRLLDGCVYVGRKIADWDYPKSATRQATRDGKGFRYIYGDFKG